MNDFGVLSLQKKKKVPWFWILNIAGWFSLFSIYSFLYNRESINEIKNLVALAITYIIGFLISIVLRLFYKKIHYQSHSIIYLTIVVIAGTLISANLWLWLDIICSYPLFGQKGLDYWLRFDYYTQNVFSHMLVFFLWSSSYFAIKLWKEWLNQKEKSEKAKALAESAQLQMLRYQLNPHFLFNVLNSIRALVDEDKKNAKKIITELSEFLRYSLISKNDTDIPLKNEIEAIRHYFSIEKIRYEDKLEVSIEIDPLAEDYPVLSFLLHPLVENAVKYGMQTSKMPLIIKINAFVEDNTLNVEITNSGKWIKPDFETTENKKSTGTGLGNVHQRLENAFPKRHTIKILKNTDSVTIKLSINRGLKE